MSKPSSGRRRQAKAAPEEAPVAAAEMDAGEDAAAMPEEEAAEPPEADGAKEPGEEGAAGAAATRLSKHARRRLRAKAQAGTAAELTRQKAAQLLARASRRELRTPLQLALLPKARRLVEKKKKSWARSKGGAEEG